MARIRTIKPEFFTSLTIADLPEVETRLTFIGLWTHVDDEGRCVDDARLVKAAIWPLDDRTSHDVELDLKWLSESSLITRYKVGERSFIQVTNWREHQKINRPTRSKFPPVEQATEIVGAPAPASSSQPSTSSDESSPSKREGNTEDSVSAHGDLTGGKEQGTGNREQGKEEANAPSSETGKPSRDDVERVCNHLADWVEKNGSKRPNITKKWRDAARLMIDTDKLTEEQIRKAIDWCQQDEFWRANIMSLPTLRKQFDRLRLAAQRKSGHAAPQGPESTAPKRLTESEKCPEHRRALPCGLCKAEQMGRNQHAA